MRKILALSLGACAFFSMLRAQNSDSTHKVTVSGYVETYYTYGIGAPKGIGNSQYFYNYARQNEIDINLGLLKFNYADDNHRGTIGLMTGNYAEYNLAAEPAVLKNIYEATVGFKIYKNLWVDAGVFPSHIGAETAIGKDNLNLSRSLIAENSPYYETGVKLSLDNGKKWVFNLLLLNGWQIMRETNGDKAVGTYVSFKPTSKLTFNSCSFAGNEKADSAKQYRIFHDLNFNFSPNDKFTVVGSFDIGMEQKAKGDTTAGDWNLWHGASLQMKLAVAKKLFIGCRLEEYWDKNGVIIAKTTQNGFQTTGFSVNLDYKAYKNVLWRTEYRYLNSLDNVFQKTGNLPTHINQTAITSLMISF